MDDKPTKPAPKKPKNGTFRVDSIAENGAPVIGDGLEVTMPGHIQARVGSFIDVEFDEDGVPHAVRVL